MGSQGIRCCVTPPPEGLSWLRNSCGYFSFRAREVFIDIFARDSGSRNTCKSGPRESLKILTDARFRQRFATWRAYWPEQLRISGLRPPRRYLPSRTVVSGA